MTEKKSWEEFREAGLLWWVNRVIHLFGWAIVVEVDDGGSVIAYPARVKFRGFDEKTETKGFIGLTSYIKSLIAELETEVKE